MHEKSAYCFPNTENSHLKSRFAMLATRSLCDVPTQERFAESHSTAGTSCFLVSGQSLCEYHAIQRCHGEKSAPADRSTVLGNAQSLHRPTTPIFCVSPFRVQSTLPPWEHFGNTWLASKDAVYPSEIACANYSESKNILGSTQPMWVSRTLSYRQY